MALGHPAKRQSVGSVLRFGLLSLCQLTSMELSLIKIQDTLRLQRLAGQQVPRKPGEPGVCQASWRRLAGQKT